MTKALTPVILPHWKNTPAAGSTPRDRPHELGQGLVETQHFRIGQLKHRIGDERLRQGGCVEHGRGIDWHATGSLPEATAREFDVAAPNQRDARADDGSFLKQRVQSRLK